MKALSIIISILIAQILYGQVIDPFPYKFSSSIYERIKIDSNRWRGGGSSADLSFIGLYNEALIEWDKARPLVRSIPETDSIEFIKTYKPVDAKKYILSKAKENRILIFNEAHFNPRNRVFVTSLLKDLRRLGYTYFVAETFANKPGFADNSIYPTLNSGYYVMEPQFGNLVREANNLKFKLYPYEDTTRNNGKFREIEQAKNIASLLKTKPHAKIIIYCGFSHIYEDSVDGWERAMAGRLKEYTGLDPYTIDQIVLSEHSEEQLNNPYYRMVKASKYSILIDKHGNPFNKRLDGQKVDALLFSPQTRHVNNRPDWIFENGKEPYILNKDSVNVSFPLIAKVYLKESDIEYMVVPIDIIEIKNEKDLIKTAVAVFKKKDFVIQLIDTLGKTQIIKVRNNDG